MKKNIVYYLERYSLDYSDSLLLQSNLLMENQKCKQDFLVMTSHPHTITLGKLETGENLLYPENYIKEKGVDIFRIDRGGKATYHGPGQLVVYPILNLLRFKLTVKEYVFLLEEVIINLLKHFNINGMRNPKTRIGIWTCERKIASVGIRVQQNISTHGIALNINPNLDYFNFINPCGLDPKIITSMEKQTNTDYKMEEVAKLFMDEFSRTFNCDLLPYSS